jgi:hypothetical protein
MGNWVIWVRANVRKILGIRVFLKSKLHYSSRSTWRHFWLLKAHSRQPYLLLFQGEKQGIWFGREIKMVPSKREGKTIRKSAYVMIRKTARGGVLGGEIFRV